MNRPDFIELVAAFKGGSSKGVGFKCIKLGNFDRVQDRKVVDVWFWKWKIMFLSPKLGNIQPWNLPNLT
jgi:hypothetical protein